MRILKRTWWGLRAEAKVLALWFLAFLPGKLGCKLRSLFMGFFLRRLGGDTVIQSGMRITNPENVSIGAHCDLAQGVFITGGGGVAIGDWVGLGPDVKIWSVNHRFDDPDKPWLLQGWVKKPVLIEDDVWLGAGVFVMPGVTIGKGAIISACAVVNKSIPPYALMAGNPARVVGWRKRPANAPPAPSSDPRSSHA
jgi:maltose O-acetyltransferase